MRLFLFSTTSLVTAVAVSLAGTIGFVGLIILYSMRLLLDEPTANLGINYQVKIFKILKTFNDRMGKTIVLITHDVNHATRFARRIILDIEELVRSFTPLVSG